MQRVPGTKYMGYFTADEVEAMVREKLRAEGITKGMRAFQIKVEQPFGEGMLVHNEIPQITILLGSE